MDYRLCELAKETHPDLVISDVSMPRMNGLEFCHHLRADSDLRSVPVLLVSAQQKDTESVVAGLRAGADDYLEVPFDSTRLVAKVSRLLERSRSGSKLSGPRRTRQRHDLHAGSRRHS